MAKVLDIALSEELVWLKECSLPFPKNLFSLDHSCYNSVVVATVLMTWLYSL